MGVMMMELVSKCLAQVSPLGRVPLGEPYIV